MPIHPPPKMYYEFLFGTLQVLVQNNQLQNVIRPVTAELASVVSTDVYFAYITPFLVFIAFFNSSKPSSEKTTQKKTFQLPRII